MWGSGIDSPVHVLLGLWSGIDSGRRLATGGSAADEADLVDARMTSQRVAGLGATGQDVHDPRGQARLLAQPPEPDAGKRLVRVSGEAKDSAALFAYIRILQANKAMTSVYLKHQQVQEHNPERPIRFTLDASWK